METTLIKVKIADFFIDPSKYLSNKEDVNEINKVFEEMNGLIYGEVSPVKLDSKNNCWTGNIQIRLNTKNISHQLQKRQIQCLKCYEFVL